MTNPSKISVDRRDLPGVADEVGVQLAVGQGPDLDQLVPPGGHDDGGGWRGRETHARHPLGVALLNRWGWGNGCRVRVRVRRRTAPTALTRYDSAQSLG